MPAASSTSSGRRPDGVDDARRGLDAGRRGKAAADRRVADRGPRPHLRDVDGCAVRDRTRRRAGRQAGAAARLQRRQPAPSAGCRPPGAAGHADRADRQARRVDRACGARRSTRTATPSPERRRGHVDARRISKGTIDRRQVHAGSPAAGAQAGHGQGDRRRGQRRGAHPRHPRPALDVRLRGRRARRRPRTGSTPPASSRCAISTAARCSSSSRKIRSRSPSAAASVLRAGPTTATTRSRPTCARWSGAGRCGDVGIVAQRYEMMLSGNHQRLELQPWQPETTRTVQGRRSSGSRTPGT